MNWNSPTTARIRSTNPNPVPRPAPIGLTEEDKERVVREFKELIKREPTEEEVEELYIEERKIKNEGWGE